MRVAFDPPAGLVSNETVYSTPGAWAGINNMRFVDGRPQTVGGWQGAIDDTLTGVCRNVINWTNVAGVSNIAFGTHSALQVWVGGEFADVTPSGLAAGSVDSSGSGPGYGSGTYSSGTYSTPASAYILRTWSLDTWGETLLGVPRGGTLYQWENSTGSLATAIANAPDNITAMLVSQVQRQVIALGCNEEVSNDFNPLCIRWCKSEDLTDWTTGTSDNAGEYILEGGGRIMTGHRVGVYIGILTDNALHQMQYVGSTLETYRIDMIDGNCGVIGTNAACVHKGVMYWVGNDRQIRAWTPGSKVTILPCPIWKDFADNIHEAQAGKLVAVSNSRFDEIWFFYPDARDGNENSRYIAFSTKANADGSLNWFSGEIPRTAACDAGVLAYPLAVTVGGTVYYHELGTDADGEDLDWSATSAAFYLSEAENVLQLQGMRPDFKDQEADITLTINTRMFAQGATTAHGPYTLAADETKADFRVTGAIAELHWSGTNYTRFGKPTFDGLVMGLR